MAAISESEVQQVIDLLNRFMKVCEGLAIVKPDLAKVVTGIEKFLTVVEPIVEEPWFVEVVNLVLAKVGEHNVAMKTGLVNTPFYQQQWFINVWNIINGIVQGGNKPTKSALLAVIKSALEAK